MAPIEFTPPRDLYAALGGHGGCMRSLDDVVANYVESARVEALPAATPWPLAGPRR